MKLVELLVKKSGINEEFEKGYQPRNDVVKDETCSLLADSQSIFKW